MKFFVLGVTFLMSLSFPSRMLAKQENVASGLSGLDTGLALKSSVDKPLSRKAHIASLILKVKSNSTPTDIRFTRVLDVDQAVRELGLLKAEESRELLAYRITVHASTPFIEHLPPSPKEEYPAVDALIRIGKSATPALIDRCAIVNASDTLVHNSIYVIRQIYDYHHRNNGQVKYLFTRFISSYDERAQRLHQWAEKLPYGEMPTAAVLQAEPVTAPEVKPEPNFANKGEHEAAVQRLARIFELKDVLTAKDVQWTQDEERKKVFAALDELIQLNALGEGEAGKEMAQMLDFMFAPTPPEPPLPFEENPAFPNEKPIVPPHPIKPLIFPAVPQGSTKTETYFPAVPKLIAMGPTIAPFIAEAMAEKNSLQFMQNAAYTLRRILGSDEAIKKLLLEHAELNEKKAQRLRELRDSIPQN